MDGGNHTAAGCQDRRTRAASGFAAGGAFLSRMEAKEIGRLDILVEGDGFFYADGLFADKPDGLVSRVHLAFQSHSQ